ncbi:hypothetical protein GUA87_02925 [Sneathiella sp. P13V-1]|uniref:CoA transferase n=1 Tax=Sneathiella sp. P13V-1 TaxID=2697366 RepID=UPI00187BBBA2|nr:CoA transferase [Sneathiella sp. P13V-1]MBE7635779.1 hypothetical protein [Sneathiella sp. P13V-1]
MEAGGENQIRSVQFRQGWFLGDGTGCGKGRQVAGIILDNRLKGRKRALWVSKNDKLLEDVPALTGANLSPRRNGLRQPMDFAPGGMFRTSDGVWLTVSAGSAETAQRLLRAVGGGALADDPRFATLGEMSRHMAVVFDAINDFVTQHTAKEVEAEFARHDAVVSRVLSVEEITTNEQIRHRGDIVSVAGEQTQVIGPVPHLSATPGKLRWLGRQPGADSQSILRDLGFDDERITALCEAGVVRLEGKRVP